MSSQQAPTLPTITEMKPSELANIDSDATADNADPKEEKDIKNSQLKENLDDKLNEPEPRESDKLIQEKRSNFIQPSSNPFSKSQLEEQFDIYLYSFTVYFTFHRQYLFANSNASVSLHL